MCICSVYTSTGELALRTTVPVFTPLSEAGLFLPEPDELRGNNVMVIVGVSPVDPSKDTSGIILDTSANWCPSSKSSCADVIDAVIAAGVLVSLSSMPFSWSTSTELYVAASGNF